MPEPPPLLAGLLPHLVDSLGKERVVALLEMTRAQLEEAKRLRNEVHGPTATAVRRLRQRLTERFGSVSASCESSLADLQETTPQTLVIAEHLLASADSEVVLLESWALLAGAALAERHHMARTILIRHLEARYKTVLDEIVKLRIRRAPLSLLNAWYSRVAKQPSTVRDVLGDAAELPGAR